MPKSSSPNSIGLSLSGGDTSVFTDLGGSQTTWHYSSSFWHILNSQIVRAIMSSLLRMDQPLSDGIKKHLKVVSGIFMLWVENHGRKWIPCPAARGFTLHPLRQGHSSPSPIVMFPLSSSSDELSWSECQKGHKVHVKKQLGNSLWWRCCTTSETNGLRRSSYEEWRSPLKSHKSFWVKAAVMPVLEPSHAAMLSVYLPKKGLSHAPLRSSECQEPREEF